VAPRLRTQELITMMYWGHDGIGGWGYAVMILNMALFWGLLIGAGILIYRAVQGGGGASGTDSARRLLGERFARGEIDDEEYRRRLETLRHGPR
jgi:putative membrane protein